MPRNGRDNLVPVNERTKDEQKEIRSKGGKASGKARRRRKSTCKLIRAALGLIPEVNEETLAALRKMGYDTDVEGLPTLETMMLLNTIKAAVNGDLAAIRLLYDFGQIPDMKAALERERIAATQNINITTGAFDALDAAFDALAGDEAGPGDNVSDGA